MKIQRLALTVGQRHQPRFNLLHIARHVGELLIGFTDVNIVLGPFGRVGDPALIQRSIHGNDIILFALHLRQHVFNGRFGLPLPVKAGDAAGQQFAGLGFFGDLGFDFTDARFEQRAVFTPQVQIPSGGQSEGAVGVPRPGIAVGIGGKRPHQPLGGHLLPFNIGGKIQVRPQAGLRHPRLRFRQPDALFGNLHVRRIG